jgi:hypothetical protein
MEKEKTKLGCIKLKTFAFQKISSRKPKISHRIIKTYLKNYTSIRILTMKKILNGQKRFEKTFQRGFLNGLYTHEMISISLVIRKMKSQNHNEILHTH